MKTTINRIATLASYGKNPYRKLCINAILFLVLILQSAGINGQSVTLYQASGNHQYTVPVGVTQITVECWGGGGAGGGAINGLGGGGAGGAYVRSVISVTPGTTYELSVAAAKTGTITGTALQNKGNPSWFGSTSLVFADGGNGGSPANNNNGAGGSGSFESSIGNIRYAGGAGLNGASGGNGGGGAGSNGPASGSNGVPDFGGNGGWSVGNNSNGSPGVNYGGGGSGANSKNTSQQHSGGNGASGMIRITTVSNTLSVTAVSTYTCQGSPTGTGTIIANATGGTQPYQFALNNGTYQTSNTFTALLANTYTVSVRDSKGVIATCTVIVSEPPASGDDQSEEGLNTWIGHMYDGMNFLKYMGSFTEPELFDEGFGGNTTCFNVTSSSEIRSIYTETFSVRFRMTSTRKGLFTVNLGSDDGSRLYIDGNLVYNNWTDQAFSQRSNVLIGLTGNSSLNYEFYENLVNNRVIFQNLTQLIENNLTQGINQTLCSGNSATTISGDIFNTLPAGITLSGTGYQWSYSTSPTGPLVPITGATNASFTPNMSNAPFNAPGVYYIYRTVALNSSNNVISPSPITINHVSNAAVITIVTNEWTGAVDNNWNNISNWTCSIPTLTTNAVIPSNLQRYPLINTGNIATCNNLIMQQGASVEVRANTLVISGTISNSGAINASAGTLEFAGTTAQSIPAGIIITNRVLNLIVNNSASLTITSQLDVSGFVRVTKGVLNTNGFLRLLSNASSTALIDGSGNGTISGNVKIQRYLDRGFGYKYFSTPFTNGSVEQFSNYIDLNASFARFYYYDQNRESTGWVKYLSGPLQRGMGYALNFGANTNPVTVETEGTVINGTVGPITLFNHNQLYTKGFNLVGNPYPSPINWNASGWTKQNIDNAIYFFDAGTTDQYLGTYSSYINGISSNGGSASNIIGAQQGFFVRVSDGSYPVQGTLTFTNAVRVNNTNPVFHKSQNEELRSFVRLSAIIEDKSSIPDFAVVYFTNEAGKNFDKDYDALKLMNTDTTVPNIYSITENSEELSINAIPYPIISTEVIQLGLNSQVKGTIKIRATEISNLPHGYKLYLKDNYNGRIQNLSNNPDYRLSFGEEKSIDRLSLIISTENLEQEALSAGSYNAYTKDGIVYIDLALSQEQVVVQVVDMTGRVILNNVVYGSGVHSIGKLSSSGIYLVNIFTDMGNVSKKVYLK